MLKKAAKPAFLFVMIISLGAKAQQADSVIVLRDSLISELPAIETFQSVSRFDPDKAALYSAALPGLGQIYNKQYWKLPFVYGGFIIFGHIIKYNNDIYHAFRNAYIAETDGDPNTSNPFENFSSSQSLQLNAQTAKRNRDFTIIMTLAFYMIQIADAHISAHLIEFDLNEDLSMGVKPVMYQRSTYTADNVGLSLVFNFNK